MPAEFQSRVQAPAPALGGSPSSPTPGARLPETTPARHQPSHPHPRHPCPSLRLLWGQAEEGPGSDSPCVGGLSYTVPMGLGLQSPELTPLLWTPHLGVERED